MAKTNVTVLRRIVMDDTKVKTEMMDVSSIKKILKDVQVSNLTLTERGALDNAIWGNHPELVLSTVKKLLLKRL